VPVEADGSAFFQAPALRSLLFVALDEQDLAVKRMQSFTTVQPGETTGCVGCHEHRTTAPPSLHRPIPLASQRRASAIKPCQDLPDLADFPRDVQPILDRNCLRCHDYDRRDGGVILSGDHGPMFSHSYYTLTVWRQLADGRNQARSNYAPRTLGSGGAPLMKLLSTAHYDVKPTERERRVVQLWLDIGAPYPGTYASLGTGSIGGYINNAEGLNNDGNWPETLAAQPVFARRCVACHDPRSNPIARTLSDENGMSFWNPSMGDRRLEFSRHIIYNLSRPEKSLVLLAPLARSAGGYGLCKAKATANAEVGWAEPRRVPPKDGSPRTPAAQGSGKDSPRPPAVLGRTGEGQGVRASGEGAFLSTTDPDYRLLLAMCEAGKRRLEEVKRFDMPGFKPREEYLREMKRFGLLPEGFDITKEPLDVYQLDRRYWDSFIYQPAKM
jgi:hypothetical protein